LLRHRVIPVLTIDERRLVKTVNFRNPRYLGDPLNAVRLFNEKEVDEIVILDIGATRRRREPDFDFIGDLASECFMPMAYGGGIATAEHAARVFALGVEKVVMNTSAMERPEVLTATSERYGAQAAIAAIDVRRRWLGSPEGMTRCGTRSTGRAPADLARDVEKAGAGELLLTSIAHDGQMQGYDVALIKQVSAAVSIPVIACGGAGSLDDLRLAVKEGGASAASAGSLFVYQGRHRAVLINFPSQAVRDRLFA
jgi:cyclase